MGENTSNNQMRPKYLELNSFNSTSSVGGKIKKKWVDS
jgi:hypothetical protein